LATIIDGTLLSKKLKEQVQLETIELVSQYHQTPHLVVILIGDDPANESYVRGKEKACLKVGIKSTVIRPNVNISQGEMQNIISRLNHDKDVHGILLQLPIPKHLDADALIATISPLKDVDGFTPLNLSKLANGKPVLVPCTPKGIMKMLEAYQILIQGKNCVVVGRSQIVGKPIANLLLNANGTVTICHSKTKDMRNITKQADILVVAIGKPNMIDDTYIQTGATVIDVGISKVDGVITGDVNYEKAIQVAGFITPVPGGVGPMTIACLLENTLICYKLLQGEGK